ncbi:unnamed protein product, partial [Didymodactylos carnosus]
NEQTGIKPASKVWEYFNRVENEASLQAECIICKQRLKTPNYSTSLFKHLLKHGIEYEKGGMLCTRTSAMSKEQKRKLDDLAIKAIVQGGRSFGDLRKLGISKFIQQCAPTHKLHLVVCNCLGTWIKTKDNYASIQEEEQSDDEDRLSQSVKRIDIESGEESGIEESEEAYKGWKVLTMIYVLILRKVLILIKSDIDREKA